MRAYSGMLSSEFIAQIRDAAIRVGSPPAVIHEIDALGSVEDLEAQLADSQEETTKAEETTSDVIEELSALLDALANTHLSVKLPDSLSPALKAACNALERHDPKNYRGIESLRDRLGL